MSLLEKIKAPLAGLGHLFFPALCEGCGKPLMRGEKLLCLHCESFLSFTNYHQHTSNETSTRLAGRFPFVHASSLVYFHSESLVQHLVHGLKYRQKHDNGLYFGRLLGKEIKLAGWQVDIVVPVPLHRRKETARGYNQATLIAEGVAETLGVKLVRDNLVRIRNTESQTDKSRQERVDNVSGAFSIRYPARFKAKHILLVDDVLTTGATLEACALTLLSVPGVRISVATAAIAASN